MRDVKCIQQIFLVFFVMWRIVAFLIFSTSCVILTVYYQDTNWLTLYNTGYHPEIKHLKYLVSSKKCKIIDLEPFNKDAMIFFKLEKYVSCRKSELLSYVTKIDNTNILHVKNEVGLSCCYSNITRNMLATNPDDHIKISQCTNFTNNVTVHEDVIYVYCQDSWTKKQMYKNVHAIIQEKEHVQKKIATFGNSSKPLSVLIVGIDSISRLNFIRNMPQTYKYVTDNDWATLNGYNKMDDNTFPNLMAILTGFNQSQSFSICKPRKVGGLDRCSLLWYDFRKLGYITGYAEDEYTMSTFNYLKKGFLNSPVDYYFRTYSIAFQKLLKNVLIDYMSYCTGPETSGERILNVAKEFSIKFRNYPQFGLFWMNSFSHSKLNSPSRLDSKVKQFLDDLKSSGVLDNVMVIFISDHGMRFGTIRSTLTGWLEERLPFIYISFPKWFKETYKQEYGNFLANKDKLTSPYDLHMTLQHILKLSYYNYTINPSKGCPTCRSLFEKIDQDRSCEDAGLTQHWCTCLQYKEVQMKQEVVKIVGDFVINQITDIIHNHHNDEKCTKFTFSKSISLSLSDKSWYKNTTYILIRFETKPKAVFESTFSYIGKIEDKNFKLQGSISRLDSYELHSKCVNDVTLKKYCYCQSSIDNKSLSV